ncbi:hypothetical protein TSOC_002980 [Tetrabaena socialis]|uniref:CBM20 domain-containing protein n=1 Tax=Tetrabaena socialis TaxID=47790 RepID=A0A2J8ACQ6_9CHLO|nr:hypothetical protein TSOC_002980 [Tetrabaena socialis]|eukprot:PNH10300.1 hypothetical protein TSOC_002980 [Tetrabaena socialis]
MLAPPAPALPGGRTSRSSRRKKLYAPQQRAQSHPLFLTAHPYLLLLLLLLLLLRLLLLTFGMPFPPVSVRPHVPRPLARKALVVSAGPTFMGGGGNGGGGYTGPASTSAPGGGNGVKVQVVVPKGQLPPGQQLVLVGGHPALGEWEPAQGARLYATGGNAHRVELQLPVDTAIAAKWGGVSGRASRLAGRGRGTRVAAAAAATAAAAAAAAAAAGAHGPGQQGQRGRQPRGRGEGRGGVRPG